MVRVVALALTGLAVLWVIGVSLAIVADDPSPGVLIVVLVQGVVALGLQAYSLRRIATGWASLSNAGRLGVTLLGVVVAPVVLALGIAGAVVVGVGYVVLTVARRAGDGRGAVRRDPLQTAAGSSPTGYDPPLGGGHGTGPVPPAPRSVCSRCQGRRVIQEYRPNPYPNHGESLQDVPCPSCGGSGLGPF